MYIGTYAMYVCMYDVCMCVGMFVCMHVCMYVCTPSPTPTPTPINHYPQPLQLPLPATKKNALGTEVYGCPTESVCVTGKWYAYVCT